MPLLHDLGPVLSASVSMREEVLLDLINFSAAGERLVLEKVPRSGLGNGKDCVENPPFPLWGLRLRGYASEEASKTL